MDSGRSLSVCGDGNRILGSMQNDVFGALLSHGRCNRKRCKYSMSSGVHWEIVYKRCL